MLILTEKPSVAKDFAKALGCNFSSADKCFKSADGSILITNCVGNLFHLNEPAAYNPEFKSWKKLPVIPEQFHYHVSPELKDAARIVVGLLKNHKNDEILIATDADREGEIIARECLKTAGISDTSRIKRFWVSQALTPAVIKDGISKAKALGNYDLLSEQGFARQHSDWLVGINGTRFTLSTGLERFINSPAKCLEVKTENKEILPPQLYSLNDLQKDAYRYLIIQQKRH